MFEAALQHLEKAVAAGDAPGTPRALAFLGYAYGRAGRHADAARILGEL